MAARGHHAAIAVVTASAIPTPAARHEVAGLLIAATTSTPTKTTHMQTRSARAMRGRGSPSDNSRDLSTPWRASDVSVTTSLTPPSCRDRQHHLQIRIIRHSSSNRFIGVAMGKKAHMRSPSGCQSFPSTFADLTRAHSIRKYAVEKEIRTAPGLRRLVTVEPIRVLIADDEALVRHALRMFVSHGEGMTVVGEVSDGIEAVNAVSTLAPDVVLMDLQMPRLSGIDATRTIVERHPSVRVIAVTTFSSERHVVPALRAGASGYLVKDTEPDAIVAAIRDVHAGVSVISPRITRELIATVRADVPTATGVPVIALTERELSIVRLIAQGMSNAEIATTLHIAEPTVKSNLARVMQKWAVRDRVQTLIYAVTHGVVTLS